MLDFEFLFEIPSEALDVLAIPRAVHRLVFEVQ